MEEFALDWEEISGRSIIGPNGERQPNPKERYRLYRVHPADDHPHLLATCATEEEVGVALCLMGREGQLDDAAFGLLDRMGEKGKRWLVLPFLPKV